MSTETETRIVQVNSKWQVDGVIHGPQGTIYAGADLEGEGYTHTTHAVYFWTVGWRLSDMWKPEKPPASVIAAAKRIVKGWP